MERRQVLVGFGSLTALALAGCKPTPKNTENAAVESEIERLTTQQVERVYAAKKRYKIAVLFPFQGIPFWVNEAYGIFDQGAKAGVDLIWRSADGYENVDRQVQQLSEMKSLGVDAVLLGATNFAGTRAAVEDLIASGIPVINHVTSTDSSKISARVLVDYEEIGKQQASFMIEKGAEGGQVIMLEGPAGAEWSGNEVKGFKSVLERQSKWSIAASQNSNPDRVAAQKIVEDLIVRFPSAVGVFSVTDSLAMGAVDALRGGGKAENMIVTTAGFSPETVEPINSGLIDLNVDESPVLIGRAALNAAVQVLNGDKVSGTQYVPSPLHTRETLKGFDLTNHWAPKDWKLP